MHKIDLKRLAAVACGGGTVRIEADENGMRYIGGAGRVLMVISDYSSKSVQGVWHVDATRIPVPKPRDDGFRWLDVVDGGLSILAHDNRPRLALTVAEPAHERWLHHIPLEREIWRGSSCQVLHEDADVVRRAARILRHPSPDGVFFTPCRLRDRAVAWWPHCGSHDFFALVGRPVEDADKFPLSFIPWFIKPRGLV